MPVWFEYRLLSAVKKMEKFSKTLEPSGGSGQGLRTVQAKMFIDCTYEGDLMAKAGVSYIVGREPNSQYNETWNGVQMLDKHQFRKVSTLIGLPVILQVVFYGEYQRQH